MLSFSISRGRRNFHVTTPTTPTVAVSTAASTPTWIESSLGAGVLVIRNADGRIVTASAGAARILRHSSVAQLQGQKIDDVIASLAELSAGSMAPAGISSGVRERKPTLHADARVAASSESTLQGEISVFTADDEEVPIRFSLRADEREGRTVLVFQENSSLCAIRKQRDRLLQIAVLGEVMPTLLHEIRNPLAAVTAMLEVMLEDAPVSLQGDLHAILCEVRRMTLGLQGIGALVRTLHSRTHTAVDLAVRETCRLLEHTAIRRNVRVTSTGPDLPLLPIDRGAICGVVFNLVKNAIDACRSDDVGHVTVHVSVDDQQHELVLEVVDSGVGMSDETLANCRELFFTTKDTGSGVGLALCHQVAEASGGSLKIQSRLGEGTRVELRVPLRS